MFDVRGQTRARYSTSDTLLLTKLETSKFVDKVVFQSLEPVSQSQYRD